MQNIKVFIIVIVFVDFPDFFYWILFYFFYCLIMAAAYPTLCCYSLNDFDGCVLGCVTLATHLFLFVALCGFEYIHVYLKRQRFPYFLARTTVKYPYIFKRLLLLQHHHLHLVFPMDMCCINFPWNHRWKLNMLFVELYLTSVYDEYLLLPVYDRRLSI